MSATPEAREAPTAAADGEAVEVEAPAVAPLGAQAVAPEVATTLVSALATSEVAAAEPPVAQTAAPEVDAAAQAREAPAAAADGEAVDDEAPAVAPLVAQDSAPEVATTAVSALAALEVAQTAAVPAAAVQFPAASAVAAPTEPPAAAQCFSLADDSDEEVEFSPSAEADVASASGGGASSMSGEISRPRQDVDVEAMGRDVREKFKFMSKEDQQTLCRRHCELAQKREEAMLRQLQATIDRYVRALEISRAVSTAVERGACADGDLVRAAVSEGDQFQVGLTPDVSEKYQARVAMLQQAMLDIRSEPLVCLPRLTPLETAKGVAAAGVARTVAGLNKFKEGAGLAPALDGAKGFFSNFGSRIRAARGGVATSAGGATAVPADSGGAGGGAPLASSGAAGAGGYLVATGSYRLPTYVQQTAQESSAAASGGTVAEAEGSGGGRV